MSNLLYSHESIPLGDPPNTEITSFKDHTPTALCILCIVLSWSLAGVYHYIVPEMRAAAQSGDLSFFWSQVLRYFLDYIGNNEAAVEVSLGLVGLDMFLTLCRVIAGEQEEAYFAKARRACAVFVFLLFSCLNIDTETFQVSKSMPPMDWFVGGTPIFLDTIAGFYGLAGLVCFYDLYISSVRDPAEKKLAVLYSKVEEVIGKIK